ncbi:MAG: hypothetical protein VYC71_15660, partial [Planctomycetota bacterium]|nr:hypothetical protein [Planctomycetota bacterium]
IQNGRDILFSSCTMNDRSPACPPIICSDRRTACTLRISRFEVKIAKTASSFGAPHFATML